MGVTAAIADAAATAGAAEVAAVGAVAAETKFLNLRKKDVMQIA
jgi:hypothetical protein